MSDKTTIQQPQKQDEQPAASKPRGFVSLGGHLHKWGTYLSIDWIFNTIAGVSFAYWGKYTESGQKLWTNWITKVIEWPLSKVIKDSGNLAKSTDKGVMFASIIVGGMFTIPPLMLLENNKIRRGITKFYDTLIYGKDKVEQDPKFEESYKRIEQEPEKDLKSGMVARALALAPLLAIVLWPRSRDFSQKHFFGHISEGTKTAARMVGVQPKSLMKTQPADIVEAGKSFLRLNGGKLLDKDGSPFNPLTVPSRWEDIHNMIAMDFGLGLPYAGLHAVAYGVVANEFNKHKDPKRQMVQQTSNRVTITKEEKNHIVVSLMQSMPSNKINEYIHKEKLIENQIVKNTF